MGKVPTSRSKAIAKEIAQVKEDLQIATELLRMYGSLQEGRMARTFLESLGQKDLVAWNAMIDAHGRCGQCKEAFPIYEQADKVTYTTLLSCCDDLGDGEEIHACVVRDGIEWDVAMSTALGLSSSSKSGFSTGMINTISSRAMEFLCSTGGDVSTRDDLVVATALVKCFGSHRRINEAEEVFERFRLCRFDLVLWNAMVWAYADTSHPEEVLFVLKKMDLEGGKADTFTFATDLTACAASCEHALL
ncbi:hypothetical protein SELMODRAFT_424966 [Selaginella moellendorffii]|uniref:Pentacotripeptide-repeat region of PRORP domain-containing protein n=1 Tax=Selaginella moellendorffii TaxID=88036 RepID=D8SRK3_SELML|nr:hypothetical protein SELMODRAFT_424966 [Selaginella moellendorffii]